MAHLSASRHGRSSRPALPPAAALLAFAALLTLLFPFALPARADSGSDDVARDIEQMRDAGQMRSLAPAQARYREALTALKAGNSEEGQRLLSAASDLDPAYPDPHFTLAGALAFQNPERAVGELSEGFRILGRNYSWQRTLLANLLTGFLVVWMVSLLVAVVGITLRHLPHLIHIVAELTGRSKSVVARASATLIALCPLLWGLGPIPTLTVYAGLLSFRIGRREAALVGLFVISSIALATFATAIAPWAGPTGVEEPSLLVDRALHAGADAEIGSALASLSTRDPSEPLYPFTAGTIARREGDFDLAERELKRADGLRPNCVWTLVNLGNVYFAREDFARAQETYEAAVKAQPSAPEPHFNLAQAYTKQLMFSEANREQTAATSLGFDRVRDMSKISAPQLNRTVMEALPPVETLWDLGRRTAPERGLTAARANPYLTFLLRLLPPAPFAIFFLVALFLLFAGLGQVLGRALQTLRCSNCQRVVCRRCVSRMQQRAFCEACYAAVKDLKSVEFTRILLTGRGSRAARRRTLLETLITFLLPGAGQILRGASLSGFVAILIMVSAALVVAANGLIIASTDVLPVGSPGWGKRIPLVLLFALTYFITVARYFSKTTDKTQELARSAGRAAGRPAAERRTREGRG